MITPRIRPYFIISGSNNKAVVSSKKQIFPAFKESSIAELHHIDSIMLTIYLKCSVFRHKAYKAGIGCKPKIFSVKMHGMYV